MSSLFQSFRAWLLGTMLALVVASVVLVGAVSYYFSTQTIEAYAGTVTRQAVRHAATKVAEVARTAVEVNRFARAQPLPEQPDTAYLLRWLELLAPLFVARDELSHLGAAIAATGEYAMLERLPDGTVRARVYALRADGDREIRDYAVTAAGLAPESVHPWNGYDPRARPFYRQAEATGASGWTPTYTFRSNDRQSAELGVTYVAPWRDASGRLVGMVDTDFQARTLSRLLETIHGELPGRIFLVEERPEGQRALVAHPALVERVAEGAVVPVEAARDAAAEELMRRLPESFARLRGVDERLFRFTLAGERYAASVALPAGEEVPPWLVAVVLPRAQIAGNVRELQWWALIAVAVVGAVTTTAAVAFASRVAEPLSRLEQHALALADDVPSEPPTARGPREIRRLAAAYNRMAERVRARQILLTATNSSLRQEISDRERAEAIVRDGALRVRRANDALYHLAASRNLHEGRLQPALGEITEAAWRALEVSRASVWLRCDEPPCLRLVDQFDGTTHSAGGELPFAADLAYVRALSRERFLAVPQALQDERTRGLPADHFQPAGIVSILHAGIRSRGELMGVVAFEQGGAPRVWMAEEEAFAASLSDLASLVLETTARVAAEEETAKSRERLRLLIEGTPLAAIDWGRDFRIIGWNPAAQRIFGYTEREMIGSDGLILVPEAQRPRFANTWRVFTAGRDEPVTRQQTVTRTGEQIVCDWRNTALRDGHGRLIGVTSLVEDVTARVRAEEEVRQLNANLEQRVAERTAALAAANEKLKELDRLKSEFLATMSHELRTPLNAIIGFTGLLKAGMAGEVNEEQKKQLEMVYGSAKHLLGLINDLLDLSRIESGRMQLEIGEFSPKEVAEEVARTLSPMVGAKRLTLHLRAEPDVPLLVSDRQKLFQIVLNLANNAVKFTEQGEVSIELARVDDGVEITVRDTGRGIQREHLPHLFEAFRQLGEPAQRVYEGAGLGLYLCKKLATLLGGRIDVESEFGRGSRFSVRLPRVAPRRSSSHSPFVENSS